MISRTVQTPIHFSLLAVALFSVSTACSNQTPTPDPVRRVEPPAAPGSGMSNLTLGADGKLYLSWIEPTGEEKHSVRFAVWEGGSWSRPRIIVTADRLFVNWADFPSLAALADGTLAAHWLAKVGSDTYAYTVNVAMSKDGGKTWSDPVIPHRDGTETEHGFVSLLPASRDSFELVWLDGREMVGEGTQGGFAMRSGGAMTLRHAALDPEGRAGPDQLVDDRVCDCCPTDAARTGDGSLLVVYRDRSETEIRDISAKRLEAGAWSPAVPVHGDEWEISGCPVNGPAVAARNDQVAVAWFTMAGEQPKVLSAFSMDGGRSFGDPVAVDDGRPVGRVDVLWLRDGTALVSWVEEMEDQAAELRVRRVAPSGATGPPLVVSGISRSRASGMPRMALLEAEVFLTWTDSTKPTRVRTAVFAPPLIP